MGSKEIYVFTKSIDKLGIISKQLPNSAHSSRNRHTDSSPLLRSSLPSRAILLIFKTYNRPMITYPALAYAFISKSNMKLCKLFRIALSDSLEDMIGIHGLTKCIQI